MSRNTQEIKCGHCIHCNYEFWSHSTQAAKIMKRLHKKICKMDGRTEQPGHKKRTLDINKIYLNSINDRRIAAIGGKNMKAMMTQLKEQQEDRKN
jgi:hypothetical protein